MLYARLERHFIIEAFAGCFVVEINKHQINEPGKTNGGALCTASVVVAGLFISP